MSEPFERRDFLKGAALVPLSATTLGLGGVAALAEKQPLQRGGGYDPYKAVPQFLAALRQAIRGE
jgi:hypothetical protein